MPFRSEKQRRAIYAAASGNSNLGIPEKAARTFIQHSGDPEPKKDSCSIRAYHDACSSGDAQRIQETYAGIVGAP